MYKNYYNTLKYSNFFLTQTNNTLVRSQSYNVPVVKFDSISRREFAIMSNMIGRGCQVFVFHVPECIYIKLSWALTSYLY